MRSAHHPTLGAFLALAVLGTGCDRETSPSPEPQGEGTLEVRVYGEAFAEEGITADEVTDGWEIRFDRLLVVVADVSAGRAGQDPSLVDPTQRVFDLARPSGGEGHLITSSQVAAGRHDHVEWSITPAQGSTIAGNATPADLTLMRDGGYSFFVEGEATRGDVTKRFAWGFSSKTTYTRCESEADIPPGGEARTELTVHVDHLFFDDLFSEEPDVSFDLIASADADDDGIVSQEELLAVDLSEQDRYQVGSTGITNLWDFIAFQARQVGHIDGEGHCQIKD